METVAATPEDNKRLRQQVLADFGKDALDPQLDLDTLMHQASVRVAYALNVKRAKVLKYRAETADLLIVAGVGWRDGVVGKYRLSAEFASPPGLALQTGQPVAIGDIEAEASFTQSPLLSEHEVRNLVNVPIILDSITWGCLRPTASSLISSTMTMSTS